MRTNNPYHPKQSLPKMPKNDNQSPSEWPLKAYKNLDFLTGNDARNIRILCEMTGPGLRFEAEGIRSSSAPLASSL